MKRRTIAVLILSLLPFGASAPAWTHHSFAAAYDTNSAISIKGKIVQVRLTNPHSWFFLDVEGEDGNTVRWSFEAGTPSGMIRNGFSPNVIKEGDVVTINGFSAKDASSNAGMMRELVTSDGTAYGMFATRRELGNN